MNSVVRKEFEEAKAGGMAQVDVAREEGAGTSEASQEVLLVKVEDEMEVEVAVVRVEAKQTLWDKHTPSIDTTVLPQPPLPRRQSYEAN